MVNLFKTRFLKKSNKINKTWTTGRVRDQGRGCVYWCGAGEAAVEFPGLLDRLSVGLLLRPRNPGIPGDPGIWGD